MKYMTTEKFKAELGELLAFHAVRGMNKFLPEDLRKFHRRQAEILRQKILDKKNAAWNWEKFLEAYKGK